MQKFYLKLFSVFFLLSIFQAPYIYSQTGFHEVTTDVGNIGLNQTNAGTIGRPGVRGNPQGPPSMEYPLNSGIEHLFEGGLWIGALYNGQTLVTTATVDAPAGYSTGGAGFEFTPLTRFVQRSTFPESDFFTQNAISHQDQVVNYTDSFTIVPGTSTPIQGHTPLTAFVQQESYAWNYSFADFFVIVNYKVTNRSTAPWDSVYLGFWSDLVIRNVNVTQETGSNFFNKGGGGYLDSLYSVYAYQISGDDVEYTRSYGASQFLGVEYRNQFFHPNNAANLSAAGYNAPQVHANFWNFREFAGAKFSAPADDLQRYQKMKKGLDKNDLIFTTPSNRTQLISVGPIPRIEPGETVTFTIALVAAKQLPDGPNGTTDTEYARHQLNENLSWSRRTYLGEDVNENGKLDNNEDLNANNRMDRYILPEPPAKPKVKVIAENNTAHLYWNKASLNSIDPISKKQDFEGFNIYKTNVGDDKDLSLSEDLKLIASFDSAGNNIGYNNGFKAIELEEPVTFEGDTTKYYFHYPVQSLLNGWQYMFVVTAFDKGDDQFNLPALESSRSGNAFRVFAGTKPTNSGEIGVYPNPYRGSAAWDGTSSRTRKIFFYNLPERSTITIYSLSGDIVATLQHDAANYNGGDIEWFRNYAKGDNQVFSGGEHAWDMLSENNQLVSHGLYMFTVKDLNSGKIHSGTFSIIK